ncbi:ABC transporter permease [Pseudomonas fluorescens]|uniref:ABC transporter permease n=1 Tax=Pseudomonas fluorescens TaxID=294 RepID=A0AAE2U2N2_PSEFL|nr:MULTISPECIES: ABC transporter permease [Pseudomonas fluorescens group]MBA1431401.1 ABC transporter permease [Pseudomonas orientalis]MBD8150307.1 ABC transporter permease [Pseudomonas fluorescens]MBD8178479.1 ABC transporter permease [Pseudomonas fluorescens]MBD8268268.1 ABC transporter permease [Pseudomonas fluorescens]MBD8747754.1 ABC transporter permease [Pseudomonas fluorescens]
MKLLPLIFKRQLANYACVPHTYLSVALFLALCTALGLHAHHWLERDSSDLQAFFELHPWLYLLLIPSLSMQLWSDERSASFSGMMKTLPVTSAECVIGKFLAAWAVCSVALLLNFPIVIAANYLGTPDNGVIASQFLASWLLAGSYLSVGCFICALTHQRIIIFLFTMGLLLTISGLSLVLDALEHQAPIWIVDSIIKLDPISRFSSMDNGKITLHDGLYFVSMILAFLSATIVTLNYKNS